MVKEKITIITTAYNVEQYFDFFIKSIFAQTYDNFVLMLIDDGSTDRTGELCDKYAEQDHRIEVYHTENRGLGISRSWAVANVKTPLLTFIDADDAVNYRFLERMVDVMNVTNADMVSHLYKGFVDDGDIDILEDIPHDNANIKVYDKRQAYEKLCLKCTTAFVAVPKLYRAEVFRGVYYPKYKRNDDEWTIHQLINNCNIVVELEERIYYYRASATGVTRNFSVENVSGIYAQQDRIRAIENNEYSNLKEVAYKKLFFMTQNFYIKCKKHNIDISEHMKKLKKDLKKAYKLSIAYRSDLYDKREMLGHWLFVHSTWCYDKYRAIFKK